MKRTMRDMLFRGHLDIIRLTKKKEVDPDSQVLRLLDGQDNSEDSDTDDDEQFAIPTKSHWLVMCLGIWGLENDDALPSKVRDTKNVFEIFTASFCSEDGVSGCGAIIRDSCHRPIVARSKAISKGKCVSPFYLELEGVALGIKLAKKYKVYPFYFRCPSEDVCLFVSQNWSFKDKCMCSGKRLTVQSQCKSCSTRRMFLENRKDHDEAFKLILDIFSDVSELESFGLPWFSLGYGGSERNEVAYLLAQLGKYKELKLKEIGELEDLWDVIYEEVFG
ncbi:uncharacterized protein LOC113318629 isoform X2 [Papaver somniferum]|nr:uncharacterized protein LOC113318629 isoform X2 [Papaver somniferum]